MHSSAIFFLGNKSPKILLNTPIMHQRRVSILQTSHPNSSQNLYPKSKKHHSFLRTVGGQKNWNTQNFLHLYRAFNCQDKVKIKLSLLTVILSAVMPNVTEFQKH
jgi:hypothetical protein